MIDCNIYFPYDPYRSRQKETIDYIYEKLSDNGSVVLIGPNGTGKTIISQSGVLPIIYEKNFKSIILCRTSAQNDRTIKELKKIKEKASDVNGIALRGRKNMCINEDLLEEKLTVKELMDLCKDERINEKGCKYFQLFKKDINEDNDDQFYNEHEFTNKVLLKLIDQFKDDVIDTNKLMDVCREKEICPYYFIKALRPGNLNVRMMHKALLHGITPGDFTNRLKELPEI